MIRAGVGLSTERDAVRAALEAGRRALSALDGAPPSWCVAFANSDHAAALPALLETLTQVTGTPYLAGCSGAGVIAEGREVERGPALGVLAVASDRLQATPFLFHDEGDGGFAAGLRLGQRLQASRGRNDLVLVWPDPLHVRPDRLLQGMGTHLEQVPVAGGAAAGHPMEAPTFQFSGTEIGTASVAGLRLGGALRHAVAVSQGCRPLGEPLRVTRAHQNLVFEVEDRPVLEVLRDRLPESLGEDPAAAAESLFVALLPEAGEVAVRPGEYLVRNILEADSDTGVLAISEHVEEGQYLLFALREPAAARHELGRVLASAVAERRARDIRFGLYFNCRARGRALYGTPGVDAAILSRALPGLPILGFFGNAEIAPLRGTNHLFTYTGVLVLVGEEPGDA